VAAFLMPSLGADMDEGTLLEWLVKPGDQIHQGDIIAVVDTDKSAIEVESFHAGTVERLVIEPGQTVPVGTVLAVITEPGAEEAAATAAGPAVGQSSALRPPHKPRPRKAPSAKPAARAQPPPVPETREPHPAAAGSPLVRHLAHELGVDLAAVPGTGPAGTITREDVQCAAAAAQPAAAPAQVAPVPPQAPPPATRPPVSPRARRVAAQLGVNVAEVTGTGPGGAVREADVRRAAARTETAAAGALKTTARAPAITAAPARERAQTMRRAIARLMARSKREIPHYYLSNTVDMTTAVAWLHQRNRELAISERLVPAALLLKAAALAARQVPELNGYWEDDQFTPAEAVHLGVPISLRGGGLLTPAIRHAADLPPGELMARLRDLVLRARAGRLRRAELTDATITVTNLGDQGVEAVFGVIFPPQVALIGIGKVADKPVAVNGMVGARPAVVTTLSADHRASDGYTGARFLAAMSDLLQRPEEL
jgi:pyruvate dehydrogenase E2 component (dihydrolipoyllysine-residue acetyltransferase)